ncbi:hypothetical protein S40293_08103 [Stachybotrys chartarum IBT 40293]|nr:hypothetical protein S40293_08103 [Stachybotrys chartarum IBT 40293]
MGNRRAQDAAASLLWRASAASRCCGCSLSSRSSSVLVHGLRNSSLNRCVSRLSPLASSPRGARPYSSSLQAFIRSDKAAPPGEMIFGGDKLSFAPDIAILGGGLTGLVTAYYVAKHLPEGTNITIYESSDRLGGWIKTDRVPVDVGGKSGVVQFERGPRSLSSLHNSTWRFDDLVLYDLVSDLGLPIAFPKDKPRYIYYPDRLVGLGFLELIQQPFFLKLILPILRLLRIKSSASITAQVPDDMSIQDWLYMTTRNDVFADTLVSAMVHGIYGGDLSSLSARSVLESVFYKLYLQPGLFSTLAVPLPIKQLHIRANFWDDPHVKRLAQVQKGSLITFGSHGMQSLPLALEDALRSQPNIRIKAGTPVTELAYDRSSKRTQVTTTAQDGPQSYDKVICTLSAPQLARLAGHDKLSSFAKMQSTSIMTVNIWYPQENMKPAGFGYLIPRSVSPELNPEHALGVFFDSDVLEPGPGEPAGTKLFVLMGGHYYDRPGVEPPTEAQAIDQAKAMLERHLGIPRDTPCFAMAKMARDCIPQHKVGHEELLLSAHGEMEEHFGSSLAVVGGSYDKIGVMASLGSAQVLAYLLSHSATWNSIGLSSSAVDRQLAFVPPAALNRKNMGS